MRSSLVSLAFSAAQVANAVKFVSGPEEWVSDSGFNASRIEDHGSLFPRQVQTQARIVELKTRNPHIPNSKTTKIRYGPYSVPGARVQGGEGMITNRPNPSIDKPCKGKCMIIGMNAGLEYADGKDANTDSLMWLHHMVLFNIGTGAWDATCTVFGAPHLIVGSLSQSSERIFSSGNERTTTFFNPPWANVTDLGYPIYPQDRFGLIIDLMNMNMQAKPVYLTLYFDYVEGHPANFKEVKPVWMDAAQCGTSEVYGRTPGAKFDFKSSAWIANFDGEIMGAGGHLHDGGTRLNIIVDGKVVCESMPTYGTDEQALVRAQAAIRGEMAPLPQGASAAPSTDMAAPKAGGHSHAGGKHIIAMSICADNKANLKNMAISPLGIQRVKKGQSWVLQAFYDYSSHKGMTAGASERMSTVMGISIMYAKTDVKRVGGV